MILDYGNANVTKLNSEQRNKMAQGLCPMCGNDTFEVEMNARSHALARMSWRET